MFYPENSILYIYVELEILGKFYLRLYIVYYRHIINSQNVLYNSYIYVPTCISFAQPTVATDYLVSIYIDM